MGKVGMGFAHTHNLSVIVAEKSATSTTAGTKKVEKCSICNKYFVGGDYTVEYDTEDAAKTAATISAIGMPKITAFNITPSTNTAEVVFKADKAGNYVWICSDKELTIETYADAVSEYAKAANKGNGNYAVANAEGKIEIKSLSATTKYYVYAAFTADNGKNGVVGSYSFTTKGSGSTTPTPSGGSGGGGR